MAGAHGVEAVAGAQDWRRERQVAKDMTREQDWAGVASRLDVQRRENERLRATILMDEQAFHEFHKQKLERGEVSVDWSMAVYAELKQRVASPAFLDKLTPYQGDDGASTSTLLKTEDGLYEMADAYDLELWSRDIKEVEDGLGCDGYVMVNQEDIVDSIASYVARYISSVPEASNWTSKELQHAMTQAFAQAEKKGRLRSLYSSGKFLYTAASWGVTALSLQTHRMVIRAASMALWASYTEITNLKKAGISK